MILIIHAYIPAGGFSCIDIKYPSGPGNNAKDVDLVRATTYPFVAQTPEF